MADVNRCHLCGGRKQVMGLGCMMKDCYECNGVGWIACTDRIEIPEVAINTNGEEVKVTKRRGRPKIVNKDFIEKK